MAHVKSDKGKPWHLHQAWIDPATLFTRQDSPKERECSDDVLSFWSKRRLLVPAEGGQGKGSHRRYTFPQVNIASIYAVFRDHFGANISTLTSLAALFQGAVETFENSPLIASEWAAAASLAQALHDFRTGTPVMVNAHDYDEPGYGDLDIDELMRKRPALSESRGHRRQA